VENLNFIGAKRLVLVYSAFSGLLFYHFFIKHSTGSDFCLRLFAYLVKRCNPASLPLGGEGLREQQVWWKKTYVLS
jgi:hypothetical protein